MRLICIGITFAMAALTLTAVLPKRTLAQIPERVIFQPGSYAGGAYGYGVNRGLTVKAVPAVETAQTEWETVFGGQQETPAAVPADISAAVAENVCSEAKPSPYLAYHKKSITGRIHVIPYQKGYPDPEEFPKKESHLKFALSALPCMTQDQPQIEYLGYYDPMPEIIEDKPSRLQLILGYPNSAWTSSCDNRWGIRQAQCIGIEQFANGPYAEWNIRNQGYDLVSPQSHFGPLQPNAGGFRGNLFFNRPYPIGVQAGYPEGYRQRLFSRIGAYQPAVGGRYESGGYNHSWCSSCGNTPHSPQCEVSGCGKQHSVYPVKEKCTCSKCSAKKEYKADTETYDVKIEKNIEKTAVKKQKQDEEKPKKSVAPPKKSSC
ncbi:hypothetical protein FACS18942_01460 [Planctomycetales bacterium]|nr:hypothetical protein FACS18942_01460 [Planctomycetales bacterium]GHT33923.1 hypothetical protein FACS189427_00340 [Planctomycetales bacterium]